MGSYSRNKGKRGEREVIGILQSTIDSVIPYTFKLKRNTTQSDGGGFDIIAEPASEHQPQHFYPFTKNFFPFAIEVKFVEDVSRATIERFWEQAISQAQGGYTPVLFYRSFKGKVANCYLADNWRRNSDKG